MVQAPPGDVVVSTSLAAGCAPTQCTQPKFRRTRSSGSRACAPAGSRAVSSTSSPRATSTRTCRTTRRGTRQPLHRGGAHGPARRCGQPDEHDRRGEHDLVGPGDGPVRPVCLTDTSKRAGDISAVGNDIVSLSAPGVLRTLPLGGTSSAAPQAAGAAAMVWTLDSGLRPPRWSASCATPRGPSTSTRPDSRCDSTATPAPGLDQYAAVLAVDNGAAHR